jgi:DNA gyrase subunit A
METREADTVRQLLVTSTHHYLLFFTDRGRVFQLKCYDIPRESSRTAKGIPIVNLLSMDPKERVTAVVAVSAFSEDKFLVIATVKGEAKKTSLAEFSSVRSNGLIAMDLEQSDELIAARLAGADDEVIMVTEGGQSIKFAVSDLRAASRTSGGVRGIRVASVDRVVGMEVVDPDACIFVISAHGFGKRTLLKSYPLQARGGSGVRTFKVVAKTGKVIAASLVYPHQGLMLISAKGIVIRTSIDDIPILGRDTQGVTVMKVEPGDQVASFSCFSKE